MFNEIFSQGIFPDSWKTSLVIFIPKPGNKAQAGFRPFRSCDDNLAVLTTAIRTGFFEHSVTVAAFLDIASAFDNVDPFILLEDLKDIGIPALFSKFVENLISIRTMFFVVDGESQGPYLTYKSTPQGSTLSPLLFDIYLRNLGQHLHPDTRFLQYADDVVLYSTHRDPRIAAESVQASLNKLYEYLKYRNLELSLGKSSWICFSQGSAKKISSKLVINGNQVPRVHFQRFLGVILDSGLKGGHHLKYLIEKGKKISGIIATLSGVTWGSHPGLLLTLYRAIFRSAVEYGCRYFTWSSSSPSYLKLLRLQYRVIRGAMGYRISTPINVMLAEAKEISFDIRLNLTTSRFIYKAMASRFSLVYRSLEEMELAITSRNCRIDAISKSRLFKHYVTSRGENIIHRSTYPPAYWHSYEVLTLQINYISDLKGYDKKDNLSLIKADFYYKSFNYRQDAVSWYTDGSKSQDGAVGAVVFTPDMEGTIKHKLPSETSVFSAELWAILQAIQLIGDLNTKKNVIFSDSESALEALSNSTKAHRNYIIYYIKQAYLNIIKQRNNFFLGACSRRDPRQ
ncbi:PREDICTED: uncharacterized protein LOC108765599 [Trachymyrmex cornetzi]|uniref:uncharacterized protein LOC108765599 n=1 Tax=Trachymyrmex cornetzi TaxID=471704 RepID=UPI00084EF6F2|nr:PREDICTED: uncharacterized protein LOC108765599 [Trachymyrmex cornetzi]